MDGSLSTGAHRQADGLRERNVASQNGDATLPAAVTAKAEAEEVDKDGKKKTFGRTPDGTSKYPVLFSLEHGTRGRFCTSISTVAFLFSAPMAWNASLGLVIHDAIERSAC